jgi:hypothetical protein
MTGICGKIGGNCYEKRPNYQIGRSFHSCRPYAAFFAQPKLISSSIGNE